MLKNRSNNKLNRAEEKIIETIERVEEIMQKNKRKLQNRE